MTTAPQWKLRRLAPRAIRVYERRGDEVAALQSFGATLVPVAGGFIESYDSVKRYNGEWQKQMREGRGAVAELVSAIRSWLPRLSVDLPEFDRSTFADTAVPDDVMEDAQRLLETVEEHQERASDPSNQLRLLPYAEQLQSQVGPALDAASKEWLEAETADTQYQQALAKTRELARQFELELVAFRATLSATFGRSDADYQKLRTSRASGADPEDDAAAPPAVDDTQPTPATP